VNVVRASVAGAAGSAFLASVCCIGPLVFALLGLGGAGLLVRMEPLRPLFSVVTLTLLALGHYATWKAARAASCGCEPAVSRRTATAGLWVATVVVLATLASPWILPFLPL
jgi:mercuric ion transport protein